MAQQDNWHLCRRCHVLFFNGFDHPGKCPRSNRPDGGHEAGNFNFIIPHDVPGTSNAQPEWRNCKKCQALFFNGFATKGRCPVVDPQHGGNQHEPALGFNFVLPHDVPAGPSDQPGWRNCKKCQALFFEFIDPNQPAPKGGKCPADGQEHVFFQPSVGQAFSFVLSHSPIGIKGLAGKVILRDTDTSDTSPALASHNGRLFMAFKGSGNDNLNLMFSEDNGASFTGKDTSEETSGTSPALVSHNGGLFIAWKGSGNDNLNVARVEILGHSDGGTEIGGLRKVILGNADTSDTSPALASHNDRLFMAFKGSGNDNLNLMFSEDNGASFTGKDTSEETSNTSPTLVSHKNVLSIGFKGSGNDNLNVVTVIGNSAGGFEIGGPESKVILRDTDTSDTSPALASHNGLLYMAFKGSGNDNLNVMFSEDNGASFRGKHISEETSGTSPALVSHNGGLFIAWKGSGNDNLNVARVDFTF